MTDQPLRPPAKIHLHPQDELGQVIQKIINDPAQDITLVVPEKSVLTQGSIALKVLADRLAQLQKTITISSASPHVITMASRAGLATEDVQALPTPSEELPTPSSSDQQASSIERTSLKEWIISHKVAIAVTAAFLVILIGGLMVANYYLPRATIIVYTDHRTIDRDVQLTASPQVSQVDTTDMVVPATVVTVEDSINQEFAATGEKEVGQRATGTITITNKTLSDTPLPAGSLVSSSGKSFVTTSAVTIPGSEMDSDGMTFGKVNVGIRASAIGPDYNLPAQSEFAIGNHDPSISGENAAALSGGSRQTVKVVSAQDRQQALQELTKQAETQTIKALQAKIQSGQLLLEDAINVKVNSSDFSHATDAQTTKFSLTLTVSASSPVVNTADIRSLLTGTIEDRVPEGYKLTGAEPQIDNAVTQVDDDGTLHLVSTFRAQIVPDLNTQSLISQVKGKNPQIVEEFLRGQSNIKGYDISLSPSLPGPLHRLPARAEAIKVEIKVED